MASPGAAGGAIRPPIRGNNRSTYRARSAATGASTVRQRRAIPFGARGCLVPQQASRTDLDSRCLPWPDIEYGESNPRIYRIRKRVVFVAAPEPRAQPNRQIFSRFPGGVTKCGGCTAARDRAIMVPYTRRPGWLALRLRSREQVVTPGR